MWGLFCWHMEMCKMVIAKRLAVWALRVLKRNGWGSSLDQSVQINALTLHNFSPKTIVFGISDIFNSFKKIPLKQIWCLGLPCFTFCLSGLRLPGSKHKMNSFWGICGIWVEEPYHPSAPWGMVVIFFFPSWEEYWECLFPTQKTLLFHELQVLKFTMQDYWF